MYVCVCVCVSVWEIFERERERERVEISKWCVYDHILSLYRRTNATASLSKNTFFNDTDLRLTTNRTIALTSDRSVFSPYPIVKPRSDPWRIVLNKDFSFLKEIARGLDDETEFITSDVLYCTSIRFCTWNRFFLRFVESMCDAFFFFLLVSRRTPSSSYGERERERQNNKH